ncbi:Hypothetical predicted protein, partial [Marmota monax]
KFPAHHQKLEMAILYLQRKFIRRMKYFNINVIKVLKTVKEAMLHAVVQDGVQVPHVK